MLGISQTQEEIEGGDTIDQEITMNKLSEGNQPLLSDAGAIALVLDHSGRIGRLKDGDCPEQNVYDDDDAKSLTLDCLKEKTKFFFDSQTDRDFVSQSSLTIISDSNLFQENSRWWSMINRSESNFQVATPQFDSSTNEIIPNLSNSINDNVYVNNHDSINNVIHRSRVSHQTRRRSSLLSDVTFESDDMNEDDQTTTSVDSSWGHNSALLTTSRRFAPNYCPSGSGRVNNEIIEEEHHDYQEKLKPQDNSSSAPAIPRRRISKSRKKKNDNSCSLKAAAAKATASTSEFDASASTMPRYNSAYALRAMSRGNASASAPTIPKRTPSHNSKKPSIKNNPVLHQIYNASITSIVSSQISQETEPSFFEDASTAAAAAAAYLSSAATSSQQEDVRTVQTATTSHTTETSVLKNLQADERRLPKKEVLIESETPPVLPERQSSDNQLPPATFGTVSSFDEDNDEHPSVVHEEPQDNDSEIGTSRRTDHQLPSVPRRKSSGSDNYSSYSSHTSGHRKPTSTLNTVHQPPSIPLRKDSNHSDVHDHAQKTPIPMHSPVIQTNRNASYNRMRLSPHNAQGQQTTVSQKHRPPTKPTRTNSSTQNGSAAHVTK